MSRGYETTTGLVIQQGLFEESATAKHNIGTRMQLADGRVFYYALNGAAELAAGKVAIAPSVTTTADWTAMVVAIGASVGGKTVSVTAGGTDAIVAGWFAEGFLGTSATPGHGYNYKIKANTAAVVTADAVLTLYDPVQVAITTSTTVTMVASPFRGLVISAASGDTAMGIPTRAVTAANYFWLQTWGIAQCLSNGGAAKSVMLGADTTGDSVIYWASDTTALNAASIIGRQHALTGITAEYNPIFLTILP